MRSITVDFQQLVETGQGHAYLAQTLSLPDWYGANLDALYDCMTEPMPDTVLRLEHTNQASAFGCAVLRVLRDASSENHTLTLLFCSEP